MTFQVLRNAHASFSIPLKNNARATPISYSEPAFPGRARNSHFLVLHALLCRQSYTWNCDNKCGELCKDGRHINLGIIFGVGTDELEMGLPEFLAGKSWEVEHCPNSVINTHV